jgi:arylsulfatase A-like enzyme
MTAPLRSIRDVLGTGVFAGLIAGSAAGAIDAVWSWGPAAQFLPGIGGRLRFVAYSALSLGTAGMFVGLVVAAVLVGLSRYTRLGELLRFAWQAHETRRAGDPREAVVGLSLVLAGLPLLAATVYGVYRVMTPIVVKSHALGLAVLAVIAATLAAIAFVAVAMFPFARLVEIPLRALAPRARWLTSPYAPLAAAGILVGLSCADWAHASWETARALPLRGPLVAVVAALLAIPSLAPASRAVAFLSRWRPAIRRPLWIAKPVAMIVLVLATGASAAVIKASTAYTGLGPPIARNVRRVADFDRDGYSRLLGGGDCDDGDATVHPGASEIPDDGVDQNCIGGDATAKPAAHDAGFAAAPASGPRDANILLVTIDTTRADHLGAYGYKRPTSPNLDAVAKEGTVFEAGWAHAPSTRYSMPAILTGRLPLDVYYDTSIDGWPGLLPKATTIAEALAPLGFVTGAITNYWYFDKVRRMDQGFSEYDNENARLHNGVAGAGPEQTRGSSAREQTDKALAFVNRHADQRWFLWVHYYDPHYAYEPHPGIPSWGIDSQALYDGEIRYTDQQIGRLLDGLRAKGLYDKTIIVATGDHGEGFGEHGVNLHGYHLYAPQTKVPFIVRVPGLPGRRSTTPAGHADLLPTLVNLAGGTPQPDMMGRSLVDAISGKDTQRVVFQQLSYEGNHEMRAGVDARCHVIYNVSPETSWEVYRIDRDPLETQDLSGDDDVCAETRRAVEVWYDSEQVPAGAAEALLPARPALASSLDATLGDGVRLLAVEASPAKVRPGETVTLTWTFEARGPVDASWRVFAHIKGPNNMFVNGDHKPVRPFEWWKPGQFIRYTTSVALPRHAAPGLYTVWTGLFRGAARAKLVAPAAKTDNNAVAATTFEVVP